MEVYTTALCSACIMATAGEADTFASHEVRHTCHGTSADADARDGRDRHVDRGRVPEGLRRGAGAPAGGEKPDEEAELQRLADGDEHTRGRGAGEVDETQREELPHHLPRTVRGDLRRHKHLGGQNPSAAQPRQRERQPRSRGHPGENQRAAISRAAPQPMQLGEYRPRTAEPESNARRRRGPGQLLAWDNPAARGGRRAHRGAAHQQNCDEPATNRLRAYHSYQVALACTSVCVRLALHDAARLRALPA
eukprot:scaffold123681_cov75-Phaeocystis_antarctica.AAC.3